MSGTRRSDPVSDPVPDPLIGAVFDGCYCIEELIGDGGMGRVYRATHELLEIQVAVKVLDPYLASQPSFVERFEREAEVMASIQHENVVKQLDSGRSGRHIYFVMELLEGQELARLVGRGKRIPWARLKPIAVQLTRALAAAHAIGVVHRDMKPANIFLINDEHREDVVKVLDFGIAKTNDGPRLTRTNMIIGTASYISPEQVTGGEVDGRSDVYAVGCILFEALTGRPPFTGDTPVEVLGQHAHSRPPQLRAVAPDIPLPEGLELLIARTLAKRKDLRIASMLAFEEELLALADIGVEPTHLGAGSGAGGSGAVSSGPVRDSNRRTGSSPDDERTAELASFPSADGPSGSMTMVDEPVAPSRPYWSAQQLTDFALLCLVFALRRDEALGLSARHGLEVQLLYWAPHLSGDTIRAALRSAESTYASAGSTEWCALLGRVAASIPSEWYGQLTTDLFAFTLADGRLSEPQLRVSSWISEELELEGGATLLCLAILWLTLGNTAEDRLRFIAQELREWAPQDSSSETLALVHQARRRLEEDGGGPAALGYARAASEWLLRVLDEDGLRRVLAGLWRLAGVDGHIQTTTQRFILDFAERVADAKRGGEREPAGSDRPELSDDPAVAAELECALDESLEAMDYLLEALAGDRPSMQELAEVSELLWRGSVELLSTEAERVTRTRLRPALRERSSSARRRLALMLTLLELEGLDQPTLALDLYEELDTAGRRALLDGLAHWDDPRADSTAVAGLRRFASAQRRAWLGLCVERGCELEHDELEELLTAKDRNLVVAGLSLVGTHARPEQHAARVEHHIDKSTGRVREAALITGLILGRPSAQLAVKQAARDPSMALACEAYAATGSAADITTLVAWARRPAAPAHAGWVLGLIGDLAALDACMRRLDHQDPRVVAGALSGLRLASGFAGRASEAHSWWANHRAKFKTDTHYLEGKASTPDRVRKCLLEASSKLRASISLRLTLRTRGEVRLPLRRLPSVYVECVRQIDDVWLGPGLR